MGCEVIGHNVSAELEVRMDQIIEDADKATTIDKMEKVAVEARSLSTDLSKIGDRNLRGAMKRLMDLATRLESEARSRRYQEQKQLKQGKVMAASGNITRARLVHTHPMRRARKRRICFVACEDQSLRAYHQEGGEEQWSYGPQATSLTSMNGYGETLFTTWGDGNLTAIHCQSGVALWNIDPGSPPKMSLMGGDRVQLSAEYKEMLLSPRNLPLGAFAVEDPGNSQRLPRLESDIQGGVSSIENGNHAPHLDPNSPDAVNDWLHAESAAQLGDSGLPKQEVKGGEVAYATGVFGAEGGTDYVVSTWSDGMIRTYNVANGNLGWVYKSTVHAPRNGGVRSSQKLEVTSVDGNSDRCFAGISDGSVTCISSIESRAGTDSLGLQPVPIWAYDSCQGTSNQIELPPALQNMRNLARPVDKNKGGQCQCTVM